MAYFNFSNLINRYSREFTLISEGKPTLNAAGDYVKGTPTKTTLKGAIIGFTESKIHRSEGHISSMDKALHTLTPIDNALMGSTVIFKGNKYKIEAQKGKDNAEFTGEYSYTLKWVSVFNETEGDE